MITEIKYKNLIERQKLIGEYEAQDKPSSERMTMLHDNFDPDWKRGDEPHGTMIFDYPKPKTPEELDIELEAEARELAIKEITAKKLVELKAIKIDELKI